MYTIYAKSYSGSTQQKSVIDKEYAFQIFNCFLSAEDLDVLIMTDGLTGEVLYEYHNNQFYIIDSVTVREE